MKISEHWLRKWVNPPVDTAALAEQLTMAGLEVDAVEPCALCPDNVVVGRVLEKTRHPDADKLSICRVDVGTDEPLQIVCGASNVREQGVYPVAMIGAVLPGDFRIKRSKLRGVESLGMLCSAAELGMGEGAAGLLELDLDLRPGESVVSALGLDDQIIDIDLTPNRADCFSVVGLARDLAALNSLPFTEPATAPIAADLADVVPISLAAGAACPAFAGRVVRGIDSSAQTPLWMRERLRRSGVRPLHPVVDVTNYVLLELGQPMHAYDLAKLQGGVTARMASGGEQLRTLDDRTVKLADDVLVIADDSGPVALAGIMGGADTAVSADTTDVFLESAFFSPSVMAGRARRFGLHTDASLRFERGVDFTGQVRALERATELLLQITGGAAGPISDVRNAADLPRRNSVMLRRARLARLLGITIPDADATAMLGRLGCAVEANPEGWTVVPPAWRFDLTIEADLVEEVVRLFGYDRVPERPQLADVRLRPVTETVVDTQRVRALLVDRGYQEAITYSFVEPLAQAELLGATTELALANPISGDQSVMRRSLWPGLLQAASSNQKRQQPRGRLFELGVIFSQQRHEIAEEESIAGLLWGAVAPEHWDGPARRADVFDIKSDIESLAALTGDSQAFRFVAAEHMALRPGRSARVERDGAVIGWCGELHPRLVQRYGFDAAPLLFELNAGQALAAGVPRYRGVSRQPAVRRDLAVLVDRALPADRLLATVRAVAGDLLRDVRVFDVYTGKGIENGLKSVALGLILQESSRTLTELEIDGVMSAVIERLSSEFNATIRE